jgi:hypothetical protein
MNLADPFLKTSRAKEHLEVLRRELTAFHESKPCQFRSRDDRVRQQCQIVVNIKDTPDRISLIVGDVFYNLRSALDQLVWCLAKLSVSYPKGTQFPILEQRNLARFQKQTSGVPTKAVEIIESLQPYNRGDIVSIKAHPLWRLNKMCNIDKHMRIPVHSSFVDFYLPESIVGSSHFDDSGVMNIPLGLKPKLKSYMALNPDVSFNVVFGDSFWGVEFDLEGIDTIYDFVANKVIPRFARFFK